MKKAFLAAIMSLFFLFSSNAGATFILTLDDTSAGSGAEVIIQDGAGVGVATPSGLTTHLDAALDGLILNFTNVVGGFNVFQATALSQPALITSMNLSLNNITGTGNLVAMITDTSFPSPGGLPVVLKNSFATNVPAAGSSFAAQGFLDPGNVAFAQTFSTPLQTTTSDVSTIVPGFASLFSLTENIQINHPSGGFTSGVIKTLSANAVPIPGAVWVLGVLLGGSGLLGFRRKNRKI